MMASFQARRYDQDLTPKGSPLITELPRRRVYSETRPLKRQSTLVLGGARDAAICYFCSLNAPLGKAVVDREAKKGGSSSCHLKAHPLSTIGSEGYTTYPSLWTTLSTGLWATQG